MDEARPSLRKHRSIHCASSSAQFAPAMLEQTATLRPVVPPSAQANPGQTEQNLSHKQLTGTSLGKAVLMSFIVGGALGVLGALLVIAYSFTPLYLAGFSMVCVLATLGLIGAILFVTGLYPKLEKIGGMGAMLPFTGLPCAIAGAVVGVGMQTGSKGKAAMVAVIEFGLKILLVGTLICCTVSAIFFFAGFDGAVFYTTYAPGGVVVAQVGAPWGDAGGPPMGIPVGIDAMAILWAFLIAGAICAFMQLIWQVTKIPVPVLFIILISIGSVLAPLGVYKPIAQLAGGGFQVLICGAGEAIAGTFFALLSGNPGPVPFISIILLFVFLLVLGIVCGLIQLSRMPSRGDRA